jgi:hypothetical protein
VAVSPDGSHVYFVARGVLAGVNSEGRAPVEGADNLYLYERDGAYPAGRRVFIATLPAIGNEEEQWTHRAIKANVTPGGRFLVFASYGALTGDAAAGGPGQIYRYDAQSGGLLRVSVGAEGYNDNGNVGGGVAWIVPPTGGIGFPRSDPSMSDDGQFVFFKSPVGLTPRALNDVNVTGHNVWPAENVYEWEAPGTEVDGRVQCAEPGGCVYLISDGRDASEGHGTGVLSTPSSVELKGVSRSGGDVFFATVDPLVGQDTDTQLDFYDARVDGGFPAPTPPVECQEENSGEACRGAGSSPPVFGTLPSSALAGTGNLPPVEGSSPPPPSSRPPLTRAEELARALKACRRDRARKKRLVCERHAEARYGPPARKAARGSAKKSEGSVRRGGGGV